MSGTQPAGAIITVPTGSIADQLFSPDGQKLFIATGGTISAYSTITGQLIGSSIIGAKIGAMDISADGTFIVATELQSGGSTSFPIYRLDLASGVTTTYQVPHGNYGNMSTGFGDIALLSDGSVLLSGTNQWEPLTNYRLSDGSHSTTGTVFYPSTFSVSADHQEVLFSERYISDAPLHIFEAGAGVTASHERYADNIGGDNIGVQAISGSGDLIAQGIQMAIYDADLHLVTKLSDTYDFTPVGCAFSPDGSTLYILDSRTDCVFALSTTTWDVVAGYHVGQSVTGNPPTTSVDPFAVPPATTAGDSLLVSTDGSHLAVDTVNSVQIIDLTKAISDTATSAGNDAVLGTDGIDVLYGFGGADRITGGLGADLLIGGGGDDTFIDTAAGLNGDTIKDFGTGDTIVITDAKLNGFTCKLDNGVLTYTGGSISLDSPASGHLTVTAAAAGGVQITFQPLPIFTDDQIADQLVNGYWDSDWRHFDVTQGGTITVNLTGLTPEGQTLARAALSEWSDVIGVSFQEVSADAQIYFDDDEKGAFCSTSSSNHIISSSTVNVDVNWLADYGTTLTGYSFQTYVHEIGHALGLGHSGNYNETATFVDDALFMNDAWSSTVMSYFDPYQSPYFDHLHFSTVYSLTPMSADIVAAQRLYGLSTITRLGDTVYGFNSTAGRPVFDARNYIQAYTIIDSGGNDTLDYSRYYNSQVINLNPETFMNIGGEVGNVSIARGTVIENAIGGLSADTIIGNQVANILTGNGGSDVLIGGAGRDTFKDTLAGHNGDTITDLRSGEAIVFTDATLSSFTYALSGHILSYSGGSMVLTNVPVGPLIAEAAASGGVALSFGGGQFAPAFLGVTGFGAAASAGGWSSDEHFPRLVADVNGDGRADVAGFGDAGIYIALGQSDGSFAPSFLALNAFGAGAQSGGWASSDKFPRQLADVNGDGLADVVGFGDAGVYTALARSDGSFAYSQLALAAFGAGASAGGWASEDKFPRVFADVNGDGKADIVGFGDAGVYVALGNAHGTFDPSFLSLNAFGSGPTGGSWTTNGLFPRELADVNGDGMADIVGFGSDGVYVALATGGGHFAAPQLTFTGFGSGSGAGGWTSQNIFPRELGDINGDHKADIVGFGAGGTYVSYGNGDGTFQPAFLAATAFGSGASAGGWASEDGYPRFVADVNHDGFADIIGFGNAGVYVALSVGDLWA